MYEVPDGRGDHSVSMYVWKKGRYVPRVLKEDGRGPYMWGIVDTTAGDAWVEGALDELGTVMGPLEFPSPDSAEAWVRAVRYQTEANGSIR